MSILNITTGWTWWVAIIPIALAIPVLFLLSMKAKSWVENRADIGKTIAVIGIILALTNYLLSKFDFEWWWAMWLHGPFFIANLAILVSSMIAMSSVGKLAKAGALLMMIFALSGWIKVAVKSPTRTEITATPVTISTPPAFRTEDILIPKGEWSNPFIIEDVIEVQAVSGRFVRYDDDISEGIAWPARTKNMVPFSAVKQQFKSTDTDFWVKVRIWD